MDIYHYHPVTGEYLGAGLADPDPLTEGGWLIPAHATETEPPAPPSGEACVFTEGAWTTVVDRRGETWWDAAGRPRIIDFLGEPVDLGSSAPPPVPDFTLPVARVVATALLTIADGEMSGIGSAAGFAFGFPMEAGVYWIFFSEAMPDLNYSYTVSASEGRASVTNRQLEYMEVSVTDDGLPVDPAELSIQLYRAG